MTAHATLDVRLEGYSDECYKRANQMHWALEGEDPYADMLLLKRFRGMKFATNGYDYWFLKAENITIAHFGVAAVLDFFNAKVFGAPFHALCESTPLQRLVRDTQPSDIYSILREDEVLGVNSTSARGFQASDRREVQDLVRDLEDEDGIGDADRNCCCPFHCPDETPYWKHWRVIEENNECCRLARGVLLGAPLLILGQEVVINEDAIQHLEDKLVFTMLDEDGGPLPAVHFAACLGYGVEKLIGVAVEIGAPRLLLPPLVVHEHDEGFHLVLEYFRNDWVTKFDEAALVPVPKIAETWEEGQGGWTRQWRKSGW